MTACPSYPPPDAAPVVPPEPSGPRLRAVRATEAADGPRRLSRRMAERRGLSAFVDALRDCLDLDPIYAVGRKQTSRRRKKEA